MLGCCNVAMGKHDVLGELPLEIITENLCTIDEVIRNVLAQMLVVLRIHQGLKVVAQTGEDHCGTGQNPIKWMRTCTNLTLLEMICSVAEGAQ